MPKIIRKYNETSLIVRILISTLAACGSSGVAGGSLLLIPMSCSLFGIPQDTAMAMVGVGYIINVIQDSFETALNSSGDVLFTATAEYRFCLASVHFDVPPDPKYRSLM